MSAKKIGKRAAKVKLGLDHQTPAQLGELMLRMVKAMTGNPHFTDPPEPLDAFSQLANDTIEASRQATVAHDLAVQRTSELHVKVAALRTSLTVVGHYIQQKSGGDEAIIRSGGADVQATAQRVGALPAPAKIHATAGDHAGVIDLGWGSMKGAQAYKIEICTGDVSNEANWQFHAVVTSSKHAADGLKTGTKYWFRVSAVGAAGSGALSAIVGQVAPL